MIPLKINKKKYLIPELDSLTVRQFIDIVSLDKKGNLSIDFIKYICYFTGFSDIELKESNLASISTVRQAAGELTDYTKYKHPGYIKIDGKKVNCNELTEFGQRYLVEQMAAKEDFNIFDLYVFTLAVAIKGSLYRYDIGKVSNFKDYLMDKNYIDILGPGYFFFLKYRLSSMTVTRRLMTLAALRMRARIRPLPVAIT